VKPTAPEDLAAVLRDPALKRVDILDRDDRDLEIKGTRGDDQLWLCGWFTHAELAIAAEFTKPPEASA
jgi:hypothetical protein